MTKHNGKIEGAPRPEFRQDIMSTTLRNIKHQICGIILNEAAGFKARCGKQPEYVMLAPEIVSYLEFESGAVELLAGMRVIECPDFAGVEPPKIAMQFGYKPSSIKKVEYNKNVIQINPQRDGGTADSEGEAAPVIQGVGGDTEDKADGGVAQGLPPEGEGTD